MCLHNYGFPIIYITPGDPESGNADIRQITTMTTDPVWGEGV